MSESDNIWTLADGRPAVAVATKAFLDQWKKIYDTDLTDAQGRRVTPFNCIYNALDAIGIGDLLEKAWMYEDLSS